MSNTVLITEKHHFILRICHWFNFIFLALMVWSGILIYWAHQPYIKIPSKLAEELNLNQNLAQGMGWHFFIMWPFALNGFFYISFLVLSGEWRNFIPDRQTLPDALQVFLYEIKLRKTPPPMRGKFNALQGLAYLMAMLMGTATLITGLAIYKPVTLGWLTSMLGGYEWARFEHFLMMSGLILFFIVHVIQVRRAGWNNFRSMVAGYEIPKE